MPTGLLARPSAKINEAIDLVRELTFSMTLSAVCLGPAPDHYLS